VATFFQAKMVNFQPSKESSISSKSYLYVQRCCSPDTKWRILPGYRYRVQHRHHMFLESNWKDCPELLQKKIDNEGNKFIHCAEQTLGKKFKFSATLLNYFDFVRLGH